MNKTEKNRIVNCIIADIPTTDHIAQARSDFAIEVERKMPPAVLKIWKDPVLSDWINLGSYLADRAGSGYWYDGTRTAKTPVVNKC